jgi:hypothetical protein
MAVNIKIDVKEAWCECVDRIQLADVNAQLFEHSTEHSGSKNIRNYFNS